ncbi:MAG: hypothetical protein K0S41_470 [Anaerocolumna sp.]|jgi:peptidoglycan hydrolase CwlO-like protein|nr:hypothetical protein [Anaerocolumna sp.]
MTIEVAMLISSISVAFGVYQGIINIKRNKKNDDQQEASQSAMMMTKLDNIDKGVDDIKKEIAGVKADIKEDRERIIRLEESLKQAHKRIDSLEVYNKTNKKER